MDAFDQARLKHAKNLERRLRVREPQGIDQAEEVSSPVPNKEPKEQKEPSTAAIITVMVTLPDGGFSFRLLKPAIYQNANKSKINKNEFQNRIIEGLRPLLGGLIELPFGGD